MLFLASGTLPNHNKNHSKIFFPIPPICPHTHRRLWWFDTVVLYPRTQSQPGLTHFMWWSCSFVEKPFVTGGCESVLTFSFSCIYFPPFHLSVHVSLRLSSLVFIPLFVLILSSPLTFPLTRLLCLCQCLHTNVKWLCSSFMVTVITELRCIVGAFKGQILHQHFTFSYSAMKSGHHMFCSAIRFRIIFHQNKTIWRKKPSLI